MEHFSPTFEHLPATAVVEVTRAPSLDAYAVGYCIANRGGSRIFKRGALTWNKLAGGDNTSALRAPKILNGGMCRIADHQL